MIRWLASAILPLVLSACEAGEGAVPAISRARAEAVYRERCAICHGEAGDGRGPRRGSLYRKPPDFRQPAWRHGKSLAEVRQVIREGRPGSDMPAWKSLDAEEIAGLAEYVLAFGESAGDSSASSRGPDSGPGIPSL